LSPDVGPILPTSLCTIAAWAADQVGCFYTSLSVAGDKSWNEG